MIIGDPYHMADAESAWPDAGEDEPEQIDFACDVRWTRCPKCGCVITEVEWPGCFSWNGCPECDACRDYAGF